MPLSSLSLSLRHTRQLPSLDKLTGYSLTPCRAGNVRLHLKWSLHSHGGHVRWNHVDRFNIADGIFPTEIWPEHLLQEHVGLQR